MNYSSSFGIVLATAVSLLGSSAFAQEIMTCQVGARSYRFHGERFTAKELESGDTSGTKFWLEKLGSVGQVVGTQALYPLPEGTKKFRFAIYAGRSSNRQLGLHVTAILTDEKGNARGVGATFPPEGGNESIDGKVLFESASTVADPANCVLAEGVSRQPTQFEEHQFGGQQ